MSKEHKFNEKIIDALSNISIKFDELGFVPTTLNDKNYEYFVDWFKDEVKTIKDESSKQEKTIADLEAKLAESEKESKARYSAWQEEIRECDRLRVVLAESKEKCEELKQAISKCTGELPPNVAFDIANDDIRYQIVCNLTDRNQEHRKTIRELKQQLAESELEAIRWEEHFNNAKMDYECLQEQLAEKDEMLNSDYYKMCPRCKNPYGASQFPSKDENGKKIYICSNCNEKELFYEPLIKQLEEQNDRLIKQRDDANLKLAEKDRQIEQLKKFDDLNKTFFDLFRTAFKEPNKVDDLFNTLKTMQEKQDQDKISFAVEKLEKVEEFANSNRLVATFPNNYGGYEETEPYITIEDLSKYIINQIKQLKEGK